MPDTQPPAVNDAPTVDAEHAGESGTVSISAGVVLQSLAGRGAGTHLLLAAASVADGDQSPAPPAPQPSSGRYQLAGEIARGGMGAVYRLRDADLGREIAAKVLLDRHGDNPQMLVRFVEEAQIAGQLQHPGIVPVYDLGAFADARPYFTMKLVKGRTLAAGLAARESPAADRPKLLKVFEAVCQAVGYAHSRGVIHRDLKPANVMVGNFGEVQVMDWGLAKVLRADGQTVASDQTLLRTRRTDAGADAGDTQAGSVLGTPAYMPPEQALGEIDRLDRRADVFGLGAILCEILTGLPPYAVGDTAQALRRAVRADLADAFARLDASRADCELIALAKRCLAPEPDDRPADAGVLAQELSAHLESVAERLRRAETAAAEAAVREAEGRKRRKLYTLLAGAVAGLVAVVAGAWWYTAEQRAERERAAAAKAAETERQGHDLLGRAEGLLTQARTTNDAAKWAEARAVADRAAGLVADLPPGHELAERVQAFADELTAEERDRRLVGRLEDVWLLRAEFDGQSAGFALRKSLREYPPLFADHGLRTTDTAGDAAGWVRRRQPAVREGVVAGLDAWLGLARQFKAAEAGWLFDVLQTADTDDWRKELRAAIAKNDAKEVERLSGSDALRRQPPRTVLLLADYFRPRSQDKAIQILRDVQARSPADFWLNFAVADALYQKHFAALSAPAEFEDAVRYFTAAAALRPDNPHVQTMLGWAIWLRGRKAEGRALLLQLRDRHPTHYGIPLHLGLMGMLGDDDPDEATHYRDALRLNPKCGLAHVGLGFRHWADGHYEEAVVAFRRANRDDPSPRSHFAEAGLAGCLGRFEEAIAAFQKVLALQPDLTVARQGLQIATLTQAGRYDDLIALVRLSLIANPDQQEAHITLNRCLVAKGEWDEAVRAGRRAQQVKGGLFPVSVMNLFIREAEQFQAAEPHLSEHVSGKRHPRDAQELVIIVSLCWFKSRYSAAAQVYAHAFAADSKLIENVTHERRYTAARYAVMAASGLGDGKGLADAETAKLRKQAVEWLAGELTGWKKVLAVGSDDDKALARERLTWWKEDPKLAVIRYPDQLGKLPPDEQPAAKALWDGVNDALATPPK